jgi:hypothetical protein
MARTAFVSSSDQNYYPLLAELVHSIRRFPQSANMDICILNAGLSEEQVKKLEQKGCIVKDAQWPRPLPASKIRGREYLKSCLCRPFIPDYFPGYDTYMWMDADTWIQKWNAVEMFLKGADKGAITLTAQADRAYPRQVRMKWLAGMPVKLRGFYFSNAKKAFGLKKAKELYPYTVLLAGAFALKHDAPHWKRWQEILYTALDKGNLFTAEQLSLGVLCYLEKYKYEILPAYTHWLCEFKPQYDAYKNRFVEPYLPHEEIGILHISGWDKMRLDRNETTDFETLDGRSARLSYRYPAYDGLDDKPL